MRQVCLLSLFVAGMYIASAQNISGAGQLATTISELQLSIVSQPIESISPADILGEKYKGTWASYYRNGNRCDSGFLQNGKPHGVWKSWYPNGQLRMQMECDAKRLSATKSELERLYKPGYSLPASMREMRQIVVNSPYPYDKLIYRQLYLSIHPPDIDDGNEQVRVNIQSGGQANWFTTGEPPFTECLVHGVYQSWFEDGRLKDSGYCDNGIREGVWEEWDESMNLRAVGFYRKGLRWKDWRYFNKEGKLEFIKWYNRQEEVTETIVLK